MPKENLRIKKHPEAIQKDSLNFVYDLKQIRTEGYSSEIEGFFSFWSSFSIPSWNMELSVSKQES